MADLAQRLPTNVPGPFFVDRSCIDCDACRELAPATFVDIGGRSAVAEQPRSAGVLEAALRALVACPVGAIGDSEHHSLAGALESFPLPIDGPVSALGLRARTSYGAASYLIEHVDGNWMIDAPRWNRRLADAIARRGGLRFIFLTHRDDVADADRYAAHFGAKRIIHRSDAAEVPDAEIVLDGEAPAAFGEVLLIPTPGHTRGHTVALFDEILFSGDHVAWDPEHERLDAHPSVCWFDFAMQLRSVEKLAAYRIRRILPGHGHGWAADVATVRAALLALARSR